jgi:hypothetical protein
LVPVAASLARAPGVAIRVHVGAASRTLYTHGPNHVVAGGAVQDTAAECAIEEVDGQVASVAGTCRQGDSGGGELGKAATGAVGVGGAGKAAGDCAA